MKYAVFCLLFSSMMVDAKQTKSLIGFDCNDTENGFECVQTETEGTDDKTLILTEVAKVVPETEDEDEDADEDEDLEE